MPVNTMPSSAAGAYWRLRRRRASRAADPRSAPGTARAAAAAQGPGCERQLMEIMAS